MTAASLGFGLAKQDKRVLLLDCDSQHSLTVSLGVPEPEKQPVTLTSVMTDIIEERGIDTTAGILTHTEGVDFLPTSGNLTGIELALLQLIGRETILRRYIEKVKPNYDFIIIDTALSIAF
jgi:chromosome partitioning protein